jgi:hypothetical protein
LSDSSRFRRVFAAFALLLTFLCSNGYAKQFGIYITEGTATKTKQFKSLIRQAKRSGLNTFVVDYSYRNRIFSRNIKLLRANGIRYVARIIVFPHGASRSQMTNRHYWKKRFRFVTAALKNGAQEIQLDYIRYSIKNPSSRANAPRVNRVIKWFRQHIPKNIPLQIDVFGIAAHQPSRAIGQNLKLFAPNIDAVCPMVYPSHYHPAHEYVSKPYKTIAHSLKLMHRQFNGKLPFQLYPYLEVNNFRKPFRGSKLTHYISQQILAAKNSHTDGYYFWSANNYYTPLFRTLRHSPGIWKQKKKMKRVRKIKKTRNTRTTRTKKNLFRIVGTTKKHTDVKTTYKFL